MTELASKTCVPCRGGVPPLKGEQLDALRRQVPEWEVVEEHHLRRHFRLKNFREALDFVNKVGELGRRARRRTGTSPRHLLRLGSGRSSSMDAQDKRPHRE